MTDFSAGLAYKLNRNARIEAAYTRRTQTSRGTNPAGLYDDATQNILGVSLRLFP